MLIGSLKHNKNQITCQNNSNFKKSIEVIQNTDFSNIDDGRYAIENLNFYYILTTYKTKNISEKLPAESHREYIDFQYIIYGEEFIGFSEYDSIKRVLTDYDSVKDLEQFSNVYSESFFLLKKDMFVIFYPFEIHRPAIAVDETRSVRKVIFKILERQIL